MEATIKILTMTISAIKSATLKTSPFFFSKQTLKFFGQTMKSFKVSKQPDGRYKINAPINDNGTNRGETVRYFNPVNNELELS